MKNFKKRLRLSDIARALNLYSGTIKRWTKELHIQVIKGKIYVEDLDIIIKERL